MFKLAPEGNFGLIIHDVWQNHERYLDSSQENQRNPAGAGSVSGYLLASDAPAVFLGAEPTLVLNEQFVDLTVVPGESKCVFVCECAACVPVMGLHAASAPPACAVVLHFCGDSVSAASAKIGPGALF